MIVPESGTETEERGAAGAAPLLLISYLLFVKIMVLKILAYLL